MDENPNFVDLNRRFRILDPHRDSEESALDSYVAASLGIRSGLGWEELLKKRSVIVLGEPGSGKTWEFRERANAGVNRARIFISTRIHTKPTVLAKPKWSRSPGFC